MKHYNPKRSQIFIPERGNITVDAASVHRIWGLPNRGRKVCFENRPDITKAIYSIYNITLKNSPTLTAWCKMIGYMHGSHDDNFLRAWLAVAFSCFLAPSTSLNISPKSFPVFMDVNGINKDKCLSVCCWSVKGIVHSSRCQEEYCMLLCFPSCSKCRQS